MTAIAVQEALLWRNQKRNEDDDFDHVDVELEVAGHEFDRDIVHLWVDPTDHPGCIITLDLTVEQAEALAFQLNLEAALVRGKTKENPA